MTTVQDKFHTLRDEVLATHFERHDEVDITLNALLIGEHVVYIGPPGTAKSMLARSACSAIIGAKYGEHLFTKFTTPEEFLGPISVQGLKEDAYRRVTKEKLPEKHIYFADEVFKANSASLNELLPIMNERVFFNDGKAVPVPLVMLIAASNELPSDREELSAMFDRFLFRKAVDYIHEDTNFVKMLQLTDGFESSDPITFDELKQAQEAVEAIRMSQDNIDTIVAIRNEMNLDGMIISDRRYKKAQKVLSASAYLAGRDYIDSDDFSILKHVLWENPQNIREVERLILSRTNPTEREALELIEMATEIRQEMRVELRKFKAQGGDEQKINRQGVEWFQKAKKLGKKSKELEARTKASGKALNKVEEARYFIAQVMTDVANEALGMDTSAIADMVKGS